MERDAESELRPYVNLCVAELHGAVRQARAGKPDALDWLRHRKPYVLPVATVCAAVGTRPDAVLAQLERGDVGELHERPVSTRHIAPGTLRSTKPRRSRPPRTRNRSDATPPDVRTYYVWVDGWDSGGYHTAPSHATAKYRAFVTIRETWPDVSLTRMRARRAPEHDALLIGRGGLDPSYLSEAYSGTLPNVTLRPSLNS